MAVHQIAFDGVIYRYNPFSVWNYKPLEKRVIAGCLVCPHEDGITVTTCSECGICWRGFAFRNAKIATLLREAEEVNADTATCYTTLTG